MDYRRRTRLLLMTTHHITRYQVRANIRYGVVASPNHHYPCSKPIILHTPWAHHAYRFLNICAHSLIRCATPGHYRPAWLFFQFDIPRWAPCPTPVAYSSSNPEIYKIPKINTEVDEAATAHNPPSQLQGCVMNWRRVIHLQVFTAQQTYGLCHLQGCTP